MDINVKVNPVYVKHLNKPQFTQIFYGGASSGKSYFISQKIVLDNIQGANWLVCRNVARTIRNSTYNEIVKAISNMGLAKYYSINKSDMVITNNFNGKQIIFAGLDDSEKIKSVTPANGGNADTVDNYHASDFAMASHTHSQYATITALNAIWSSIYPVGSIYMSVSSTSPETLFGGTWVAFGQGRVLIGVESGGTAESTGGSQTAAITSHTHTTQGHALTVAEMPTHGHWLLNYNENGTAGSYTNSSVQSNINKGFGGNVRTDDQGSGQSHSHGNTGASGGQSISIIQPYITCYMWKRTN